MRSGAGRTRKRGLSHSRLHRDLKEAIVTFDLVKVQGTVSMSSRALRHSMEVATQMASQMRHQNLWLLSYTGCNQSRVPMSTSLFSLRVKSLL